MTTALLAAVVILAFGSSVVASGDGPHRVVPKIARVRVISKPTPKPAPRPVRVASYAVSNECPQMDNPGGGLRWGPTKELGPTPTNGTVALERFGIRSPIVRVGIDRDLKMVVPHNARDVAWLDRGGVPGYTNNIVLAGHISYSRVPGSFGRIGQLNPGDIIKLEVGNKKLRYRVTWRCLFGRNTDRAEQIMGFTEKPSLTLISCGGGWDAGARTHTGRYAVRAEQI